MRKIVCILFFPLFLIGSSPDFKSFNGSAVILDLSTKEVVVFGDHANERLNPCSTFKILNAMISLEEKVVKDEHEIIPWDKKIRRYDFWNKDHSMATGISVSTVWFFQELARRVGAEKMHKWVSLVNYGNNDTSKTLSDFWLADGSLKISAYEQSHFMAKLLKREQPFSKQVMDTTLQIITLEENAEYRFGGKTGTCGGIGWFVGFKKTPTQTKAFTFMLKGEGSSGVEAKKIAQAYLGVNP